MHFIQVLFGVADQNSGFCTDGSALGERNSLCITVLMNKIKIECEEQKIERKEIENSGDTLFHKDWMILHD